MPGQKFHFPRKVLLVEIQRRCRFADCEAGNSVALTKAEAIGYRGFECIKCQRWNEDTLNPAALPDSWVTDALLRQEDPNSNH